MSAFIAEGGPFMYLILALGIAAVVITIVRAVRLASGTPQASLNSVLYLGAAALVVGVTAQLTGLYRAAWAIVQAENIAPKIVAQGVLISFNSTLFGLYVFVIALLLWLGLRGYAGMKQHGALS